MLEVNDKGQLGNGTRNASGKPVAVMDMDLHGANQIAAGSEFTCAHTLSDGVWCWGSGNDGRLGRGDDDFEGFDTPQRVPSLTGTMKLAAGGAHACAIKSTGALACWGASYSGELGDGLYNNHGTPVLVTMPGNASVRDVSAGDQHTCAVLADGSVACWGDDQFGQLGDGVLADQAPVAPQLSCSVTAEAARPQPPASQ